MKTLLSYILEVIQPHEIGFDQDDLYFMIQNASNKNRISTINNKNSDSLQKVADKNLRTRVR